MLSEDKLNLIKNFASSLSREEIIWLNGYLAGLAGELKPSTAASNGTLAPVAAAIPKKITLVYGTETGNAKSLAIQLAGIAKKKGVHAKLAALDQYRFSDLSKEENFFVIISTQGEGDPPIMAQKFYNHIHHNEADLKKMKFGVLALGDSSYAQFCKTGEDVDARLEALGAHRILPLKKCDVDYEADALHWIDNVVTALDHNPILAANLPSANATAAVQQKPAGKKIYTGTILSSVNLNDRGSRKQTYHIEITTEEPIDYQPGDALGVVPQNKTEIVDSIVALAGIDPNLEIQHTKVKATVKELLSHHLNISYLLKSTLKRYSEITGHQVPDERMSLYDLLRKYPIMDASQFEEFLKALTIQAPRLYSISSSPGAHGENEIHITVVKDHFLVAEEKRSGVGSKFLATLEEGDQVEFFIQKSKHFKLPQEDKDIIMVGPGTGIAAFRSFLAERDASGATGKNWLFFGDQHFVCDFLYQTEIQHFLQTGVLTKLDLAFSRDQEEKLYVQHRMKEQAFELYSWLENGARLFVSGRRDPMSKDVEQALLEIFKEQGKKSDEEARAYLKKLSDEGRYEKDVY